MPSSLSGWKSSTRSYSDYTQDTHTLALTISQLEKSVQAGIVTKQPLEYIIINLIQAGRFTPDSDEMALLDNLYHRIYGEHLPAYVRYVSGPKRVKITTDEH